jgi:L-rhamnose mutarotase
MAIYLFRISLLLVVLALLSCSQNEVHSIPPENHSRAKRVGMVVKVKSDKVEAYKELHADGEPGVRHLLEKYNMRNFSIFLVQLADSNWYEFAYYEYWGDNLEADMRAIDQEPENQAWLAMCDPMQEGVLPEIVGWKQMDRIYYNY